MAWQLIKSFWHTPTKDVFSAGNMLSALLKNVIESFVDVAVVKDVQVDMVLTVLNMLNVPAAYGLSCMITDDTNALL